MIRFLRSSQIAVLAISLIVPACSLFQNRVDKAIDRGVENIKRRDNEIMPVVIPMLESLIRDYKLPLNIDSQKDFLAKKRGNFRPILGSQTGRKQPLSIELSKLKGIDRITATALYCKEEPLPKTFLNSIHSMANHGGYPLTHATLALLMAKSNGCDISELQFQEELNFHNNRLSALLNRVKPESDLGIEAIVMLYLTGNVPHHSARAARIDPKWILRILDSQHTDGSWYQNDHTTVLAIWALLEAKRNGTLH